MSSAIRINGVQAVLLAACFFATGCESESVPSAAADDRPNILLIVADDLGYSDLGSYGGEISTPRLDQIAEHGHRFGSFYAAPTCSPARAMLLTGMDSHRVGLGTMAERRTAVHEGLDGYEGYLSTGVPTVAELLRDAGYRTYMTGKWHLGYDPETNPAARGFDRSFALLDGGAFHLSDLPQADPETSGKPKARYTRDGKAATLPNDYYSTEFFANQLIDFLDEDMSSDSPFFAYLAFSAPHFPLQAPAESVRQYAGQYDVGFDAVYQRRVRRIGGLGLVENVSDDARPGEDAHWEAMSDKERQYESRRMEIYAAMVTDMDRFIGQVLDYLEDTGEFENTWVFFLSDNGPEGRNVAEAIRVVGAWPETCCDNSLENLGRHDSYTWLGPGWGRVSAAPFSGQKGNTSEGGIRVPAFVYRAGATFASDISREPATVLDILPTILEIASVGELRGSASDRRLPGTSLLPFLRGESDFIHLPQHALGWELSDRRAIRQGRWKLLWDPGMTAEKHWALFDIENDPGEKEDLSSSQPERYQALLEQWEAYRRENGVFVPDP